MRSAFQMLTVEEVATRLAVNPHTVYRLVRQGKLQATRIGQAIRISEAHLSEFVGEPVGNPDIELQRTVVEMIRWIIEEGCDSVVQALDRGAADTKLAHARAKARGAQGFIRTRKPEQ